MTDSKSISSSFVLKFIERLGTQMITIVLNIVLARLLFPSDFGVVAIINVFVILAQTISQNGVTSSLIQKKEIDDADYSTGFVMAIMLSAILYGILFFCSPFIEDYYGIEKLSLYIRVISLILFLQSFTTVFNSKLMRNMQFKGIAVSGFVANIASCFAGVFLAYRGFGVWALIVMQMLNAIFSCLILGIYAKWSVSVRFSWAKCKELFGFGSKIVAVAIIDNLYYDIENLLIGKKISDVDLGYYSNAKNYPLRVISSVKDTISAVLFPALSSKRSNQKEFVSIFEKSIEMLTFLIVPMMFGFALVAREFILIFLTDKWLPSLFPMICLSIGYAFMSISSPNIQALKSSGDGKTCLIVEILRKSVLIAVLFFTLFRFGTADAIAFGSMVATGITSIIIAVIIGRKIDVRFTEQLKLIWKNILGTLLMCLGIVALNCIMPDSVSVYVLLILKILCGIIIYILTALLTKNKVVHYFGNIIKSYKERSANVHK